MDGLQSERNYRFSIKVVSGSGTTDEQINFYDDNYEFRVVRQNKCHTYQVQQ